MIKNITSQELIDILAKDPESLELVDVREGDEYNEAHIKNSKLIPMNNIMGHVQDIDWTKQVVLYCRSGARSMYVATIMGPERDVMNLEGGMIEFVKKGKDFLIR